MKNKKGFTLVELMAVIVILAIIIAIAIPTYGRIKRSIDKKTYENKVSLIKAAASKFAEDTNITAVFVKELVENGYLESDDKDGHIYGIDEEYNKVILDCYIVLSERKDGLFYSNFVEKDYTDNKTCDYNIPNELTKNFKIEIYDNDLSHKLTYDNDKKWWTKNNVILKAVFKNNENNEVTWYEGYGDETISKCNDRENSVCVDTNDSKILYVKSSSVLQQNYTAKSTDKDGNPVIARVRVYIDKIVPNFYQNHADKLNNKWTNKNINYNVSAYDNESGLYGYKEINETEICPDEKDDYIQNKKIVLQENGKRKICLIDNVGNKNDTIINVEKIDKSDINCEFIVANSPTIGEKVGNRQWYKKPTEIHLNALNIGISGVTLGIENIQEKDFSYNSTNTFISETIKKNEIVQRKGYIKNPTGNKKTCSLDIGVETSIEKPVLSNAVSSYDTITAYYTSGAAISGIKNTTCYLTDSDGNIYKSVDPKGNNCIFKVDPSKVNTTYYFKKCIESNAGNSICSDVSSKENIGYCTSGHYTTGNPIRIPNSEGSCSKSCGTGIRSYRYKKEYISEYQDRSCGTSDEKTAYENCNTQDCCSWKVSSSESSCNANCPTSCGNPASTQDGNKTVYYVSGYDRNVSCGQGPQSCQISCPATVSCGVTYDVYIEHNVSDSTAVNTTAEPITSVLAINNYSSLKYDIYIENTSPYSGDCSLSIIGTNYGQYVLVNGTMSFEGNSTKHYNGTINEVYTNAYQTEKTSLRSFPAVTGVNGYFEIRCWAGRKGDPIGGTVTTLVKVGQEYKKSTITLNY